MCSKSNPSLPFPSLLWTYKEGTISSYKWVSFKPSHQHPNAYTLEVGMVVWDEIFGDRVVAEWYYLKIIPRLHSPRALTCGQKSTILLRNVIVVGSNSIRQASGEHQLPWVWLVYRDIFEECWVCHVELLEPSVQLGISTTRAAWPSQSEAPISEDLSGFQQMARHGRATAAMSLPSRCREVSVEPGCR